jgi:hypothetical protein
MWNERLAILAASYPTAILSRVDPATGYPESVRLAVRLDAAREMAFLVDPPDRVRAWSGQACLLFHEFNQRLEGLRQLVVLGELVAVDDQLGMKVTKFVTAYNRRNSDRLPHASSPLHMLQFLWIGRRNARRYLAKRGAPWPQVPYDEIARALAADQPPGEAVEGQRSS